MRLPKFEYHDPADLNEACALMQDFGGTARIIAGGTDLLVNMKKKLLAPAHLVSVGRLEELRVLDTANGTIRIGARLTAAELADAPDVRRWMPALADGAAALGTPLIRNSATVGGNLVTARPAADLPPGLIAHGATVTARVGDSELEHPVEGLATLPGRTVLPPEAVITGVNVPKPPQGAGSADFKLGVRKSMECSIINVAAYLELDADHAIRTARVVLGAVAPTHIRAASTEAVLMGEKADQALLAAAGEAAARDCRAISDFRGGSDYRREMVKVYARRALETALKRALAS